jgi:GDPmannose 4,6-dehydratase
MKALITGISGQDGTYLYELLREKGYEVHGIVRRTSFDNDRLKLVPDAILHYGDVTDAANIRRLLAEIQPDEIYNLAAQSDVRISFDIPAYTFEVNAVGVLNILEAMRAVCPKAKLYQASTSEMFGKVVETPQDEGTPFNPRSPYGVAKTAAHFLVNNYRDGYGLYACSGILFNHESPRRGTNFVTRKISLAVANILYGKQKKLVLGDLTPSRDWGHAKDYVKAMWLMLQQPEPDDYVIATGETHTVQDFVKAAFCRIGQCKWQKFVEQDPALLRPTEVNLLIGNATKARENLGWEPEYNFTQLVEEMVGADIEGVKNAKT